MYKPPARGVGYGKQHEDGREGRTKSKGKKKSVRCTLPPEEKGKKRARFPCERRCPVGGRRRLRDLNWTKRKRDEEKSKGGPGGGGGPGRTTSLNAQFHQIEGDDSPKRKKKEEKIKKKIEIRKKEKLMTDSGGFGRFWLLRKP